ncbi:MAG: ABC transporter permease [Acidimicrobiales bacterium]
MFKLGLRGVRYNLGRYIATLLAIVTGVAFFSASGFVADRVISAFEGDVDRQYGAVDAALIPDDRDDFSSDAAFDLRVGGQAVDAIAALDETAAVAGDLTGDVAFLAPDGDVFADNATGRLWIEDDDLNPTDLEAGTAPAAAGEIAVDRGLADDHDLTLGDAATLLTLAGPQDVTITAITGFGDSDAQDGVGTVSIPAATAFEWLNRGQVEFAAVYLRANGEPQDLVAAVEPLVPAGFRVQDGDEFRADLRVEVGGIGRALERALQFFATLALLVGGFVIYNTFNVIVAQRTRELAVLAAIGATPKQLRRSLRSEALLIGLLGSALGVIAGFGLAFALVVVLARFGVELPGSGIEIGTDTVVVAMLFGTVVTLVSATLPARRAGKAEPIEALRQADAGVVGVGRARSIAAAVLTVGGIVAMLAGPTALIIGLGTLVLFVGVIALGPLIAVAGSKILGPVLGRFGLEGRLAADNTARNPSRTATTSNALLIGVFLVTFVSVAGTSAKDYAVAEINELSTADFTIESTGGTIDETLVGDIEAVDGVELVTPFRRETVALTVDGEPSGSTSLSTGDLDALREAAGIELDEGSYDDLGPGTVVLLGTQVASGGGLGSTAVFTDSAGDVAELEVVGVIGVSLDAMVTGAIVAPETFDAFVGDTAPTFAFVKTAPGVQTDVEDAIADVTDLRPDVSVQEGNLVGRVIGQIFDFLINAVNGLLLMSVIVALIGIVNTMTLSILERRRELGLLRIVGMVDRRVRRMVRIESVLIAALGTVSGMLLGTFSGFALITAIGRLSDAAIDVSFPPLLLGAILALGVGLGFIAALIPAQRSTKLDVLDAIQAS